jgi:1-deoxy-D-xylulose-5-phosphate synthase
MSPKDENEFRHMLHTAVHSGVPAAVRYPRGNGVGVELDSDLRTLQLGKGEIVRQGRDALCVAFGPIIQNALQAAEQLSKDHGIECAVINARFAKPLDQELLARELPKYEVVCTLEDHAIAGGFGSAVIEFANDRSLAMRRAIKRFGVQDSFVTHGSQSEQHALNGYDAASIVRYILANSAERRRVA